jgi:thiol:disulfide interchange protein
VLRRRFTSSLVVLLALAGCDVAPPHAVNVATQPGGDAHPTPSVYRTDVAAAIEEAARLEKPLLLYFTADWCTYCRQLRREVLECPEVRAAAERFVCVEVNAAAHPTLCDQYRVRAYPTLVLAAPGGTAIERMVGLTTPTALLAQLNAAAASVVAAREERTDTALQR